METILIPRSDTYLKKIGGGTIADASELDLLEDGAISIIDTDGDVIPATGFGASTNPYFQIVLKTVGGGLWRTPIIERSTFRFVKEVYVATVNRVQVLTFSGTPNVGKEASVFIKPATYVTPIYGKDYEEFGVGVVAGDTLAGILTKIATKINAGSEYCTAVAGATTITLTGIADISFNGGGMYELLTYTAADTTSFVKGHGMYSDIAKQEIEASAHKGNPRYKSYNAQIYPQSMQAVVGATYTTFTFGWKKVKYDALNSNGAPYNQEGMIATDISLTTLIGVLETIFNSVN